MKRAKNLDAFDNANAITVWRYVDVLWKIKRALRRPSYGTI